MSARTRGRVYWGLLVAAVLVLVGLASGCTDQVKIAGLSTVASLASARGDAVKALVVIDHQIQDHLRARAKQEGVTLEQLEEVDHEFQEHRKKRDATMAGLDALGDALRATKTAIMNGTIDLSSLLALAAKVQQMLEALGINIKLGELGPGDQRRWMVCAASAIVFDVTIPATHPGLIYCAYALNREVH